MLRLIKMINPYREYMRGVIVEKVGQGYQSYPVLHIDAAVGIVQGIRFSYQETEGAYSIIRAVGMIRHADGNVFSEREGAAAEIVTFPLQTTEEVLLRRCLDGLVGELEENNIKVFVPLRDEEASFSLQRTPAE